MNHRYRKIWALILLTTKVHHPLVKKIDPDLQIPMEEYSKLIIILGKILNLQMNNAFNLIHRQQKSRNSKKP